MSKATITTIDYQRNGVSGEGFHSLQLEATLDGEPTRFIATVFEGEFSEDELGNEVWGCNGRCAVQEIDEQGNLLPTGWRGDQFEPALRRAIDITDDDRYVFNEDGIPTYHREVSVRLTYTEARWVVVEAVPA